MTDNARTTLEHLVANLTGEIVAKFLKRRMFADDANLPCSKWSILNQLSVTIAGTNDARGIRQWQAAGRTIKPGCNAFYIYVPLFLNKADVKNRKNTLGLQPEDADKKVTCFKTVPVFRVEDTEGDTLDYELVMRDFKIESLPLITVAQSMGIRIKKAVSATYYGWFNQGLNTIQLSSDEPLVFLHELAHAIDAHLPEQNPDKVFSEIVAELSAAFLGSLYGYPPNISDVKAYIQHFTGKGHVAFHISKALKRVEEIYQYIEGTQRNETTSLPKSQSELELFPNNVAARRLYA